MIDIIRNSLGRRGYARVESDAKFCMRNPWKRGPHNVNMTHTQVYLTLIQHKSDGADVGT